MFDNAEIDKLIIFALLGMVAVLGIAVIVLAVKKNTYYVDDNGNEIQPVSKKEAEKKIARQAVAPTPVEPITLEPKAEEDPFESKLQESMSVKPANPTGLNLTITINGQKQQVSVNAFPALLGRDSNTCEVPVTEPAVSRKHARFTLENGTVYLEDVSEHNGTFINGTKLPPLGRSKVSEGDKINLGRAEIIVDKIVY
jgi:pSer/pThr/pTyr-binding forkhead associated (FHA) protein